MILGTGLLLIALATTLVFGIRWWGHNYGRRAPEETFKKMRLGFILGLVLLILGFLMSLVGGIRLLSGE